MEERFTLPEIRTFCGELELPKRGKKSDLIARIVEIDPNYAASTLGMVWNGSESKPTNRMPYSQTRRSKSPVTARKQSKLDPSESGGAFNIDDSETSRYKTAIPLRMRIPGSKWIHMTTNPNIVVLKYMTWISILKPESAFACIIDRDDIESLAHAKSMLVMGVPERHLRQADREQLALDRWFHLQ